MSGYITYLLGAGASANCIPVVNAFKEGFKGFVSDMQSKIGSSNLELFNENKNREYYNNLFKTFFEEYIERNPTVDIKARKLFIQGATATLLNFKQMISTFFYYRQLAYPLDERYDKLFAALFQTGGKKNQLAPNVKIITWNYDLQPEIAYQDYTHYQGQGDHLSKLQNELNSYPRTDIDFNLPPEIDKFTLVRLNGIAGLYENTENELKHFFDFYNRALHPLKKSSNGKVLSQFSDQAFTSVLDYYKLLKKEDFNISNTFTYSWEKTELAKYCIEVAKKIAEKTTILVIIGYSFPYVNREVDNAIFDKFDNLKKIYIQDIKIDENTELNLKNKFKKLSKGYALDKRGLRIETIKDIEEFYIPNEL